MNPPTSKTPGQIHAEADQLQQRFQRLGAKPFRLVLTTNRVTFMSFQHHENDPLPSLRLHRCFLAAPDEVLTAIIAFTTKARAPQLALIRQYAETQMPTERPTPTTRLRSRGRIYNLHTLMAEIIQQHFPQHPLHDIRITYGKMGTPTKTKRRSIRYGAYSHATKTITIHPRLDAEDVPETFVRFVIFHELIHAVLPRPQIRNGRRIVHDQEFRAIEAAHPDYQFAEKFARDFLNTL